MLEYAYEMYCAGGRQGRQAVAALQKKLSEAVHRHQWEPFDLSGDDCPQYGIL